MLDEHSSTPLYKQLKEDLLAQINAGSLRRGERVPTEMELSERYGVSRVTVRKALTELVDEGRLTRRQGKGTYVNNPKIGENIMENLSFTSVCQRNGMVPGTKLISVAIRPAGEEDVRELGVSSDSRILYLHRLRYADGVPVVLEENFFTERFCPLIREDLEHESIYALLTSRFGITRLRPSKSIEIARATEWEASQLGVKKRTPVLLVRELMFEEPDVPVHRTRQIVLGDRFKYEIR